jgi:hypothetical protein
VSGQGCTRLLSLKFITIDMVEDKSYYITMFYGSVGSVERGVK